MDYRQVDDAALLQTDWSAAPQAATEYVKRHEVYVRKFFLQRRVDAVTAAQCAMEVFVKIMKWQSTHVFENSNHKGFLIRSANSVFLTKLRDWKREARYSSISSGEELLPIQAGSGSGVISEHTRRISKGPEETLNDSEFQVLLQRLLTLTKASTKVCKVVRLRINGYTFDEIDETLDLTIGDAKSIFSRFRLRARQFLGRVT
jgi:DNA-directed RNA polymerase specialized sigma24 family protein